MSNVITNPHAPTLEDRVAELPRQGQYGVLHADSRHKVDEFAGDMRGTRAHALREMRPAFKALLIAIMETVEHAAAVDANQRAKAMTGMVAFHDLVWTAEGRLDMIVGAVTPRQADPEGNPRAGIDELVEEVVARAWPPSRRPMPYGTPESLAVLTTGLLTQFAEAAKDHPALELRRVRFEHVRFVGPRLVVDVVHKERLLPHMRVAPR